MVSFDQSVRMAKRVPLNARSRLWAALRLAVASSVATAGGSAAAQPLAAAAVDETDDTALAMAPAVIRAPGARRRGCSNSTTKELVARKVGLTAGVFLRFSFGFAGRLGGVILDAS